MKTLTRRFRSIWWSYGHPFEHLPDVGNLAGDGGSGNHGGAHEQGREEAILHVFDPLGNKHWKTWDWNEGRLMLCAVAGYEEEWYGPPEVSK